MSELINNREYRQQVLKELIMELHHGKTVEEVKPRFEAVFEGVSTAEISELEQALIEEGMKVEEIQKLCDVHAAFFKGSIAEIHQPGKLEDTPGHPLHTFKLENRAIEKLIDETVKPHLDSLQKSDSPENRRTLRDDLERLEAIDRHYSRKENLVFPFMEKYGITAPPKVMWGADDEIRALIKEGKNLLTQQSGSRDEVAGKVNEAVSKITEMIFKEEHILFPMTVETFSEDEWATVAAESDEIGYCLIQPQGQWKPVNANVQEKLRRTGDEYVHFETGMLSPEELNQMLNTLPIDLTFVDKDGAVKYFSQAKDRIFPRTKAIIGRNVANCHPPASVHIVEKIVEDFKAGRKDQEDFWINMGPHYVYIRYFAVRSADGEYLGTMEVTQDIAPVQAITGEKRLLST